MNRYQCLTNCLAFVLFIVFAATLAVKSNSTMAKAQIPLVLAAPAGAQDEKADAAGRPPLQTPPQQLTPDQLKQALEIEYAIGMAALRMKNWPRAVLAFEKILQADQKFRDAGKRLAQTRRSLARESQEAVAAGYYAEGISAMSENDLGRALAAFEKIGTLAPNYRDVDSLAAAIAAILQQKTAAAAQAPEAAPASAQPENAEAENSGAAADGGRTFFYLSGAFAGLAVLFAFGVIGFSPLTRARLHLLRGNPAAAAQIYERMLNRHPERVKLYLPLANIYLSLGKRDERAMRAYKTILYLNLATRQREEINSIVAQKYLTEGRTDSDAIAVLEDALKTERRRQDHR
jgi:tetratricopeptide (TPR) repeat protein